MFIEAIVATSIRPGQINIQGDWKRYSLASAIINPQSGWTAPAPSPRNDNPVPVRIPYPTRIDP